MRKGVHLLSALLCGSLLIGCSHQKNADVKPVMPAAVQPPADPPKPVEPSPTAALDSKSTDGSKPTNSPSSTPPPPDDTEPAAAPAKNIDPYEKFNRAMYSFNDHLDRWILHPIAKTYDYVTPPPIHKGITNFFDNIDMLTTIPNDLLQAKFAYFTADTWRFILNSTIGIGGLFDIATRAGLPKHHEDFGMTFAYWGGPYGLKPQPYLVLPFFGPSTTRDAFARIPAAATWPFNYIQPEYYNYGALALDIVNKRANLLAADKLVSDAFDPYIFVRSAYLQSRMHDLEKNLHETDYPPYTTETNSSPTTDNDDSGNEL